MPRNASGTYTLPAGNPVSAGTLIEAAWANTTLNDLAAEMTDSLSRSGEGGMLASFKIADGTVSLPGLAFTLEPGTGLSRLGTNEFDFSVGGSRVIQLNVNGMTVTAGLAVLVDTINESTADAGVTIEGTQLKDSNVTVVGDVYVGDDLVLDSDSAVIYFGADQDVLLTHVADTGLTMSVTGNNVAQLSVTTDKDTAATGPILNLTRYSGSPGAFDGGGIVQFNMENSADELFNAAQIYAVAVDVTDTEEDGKLLINTMKAGTATTNLTISNAGIEVADDGYIGSATTPDSIQIRSDGNVGIGTSASDTIGLYVANDTTGDKVGQFYQANSGNTNVALQVSHSGAGTGLYSQVELGTNSGVYGYHNGDSSNRGIGTRGHAVSGYGVYGRTGDATYAGVIGYSADATSYGMFGYANTYGVYGTSLYTPGALYKGSGTFRIPHGLREGFDLLHSFVEGPRVDLIYRSTVNLVEGRAEISIDTEFQFTPGTFVWLTKNPQTFTSNETGFDAVKSSFSGDTLTIECQNADSTDTISWMVVAERDDPNIRASEITDDDGNLIIERPSDPPPPPTPPEANA